MLKYLYEASRPTKQTPFSFSASSRYCSYLHSRLRYALTPSSDTTARRSDAGSAPALQGPPASSARALRRKPSSVCLRCATDCQGSDSTRCGLHVGVTVHGAHYRSAALATQRDSQFGSQLVLGISQRVVCGVRPGIVGVALRGGVLACDHRAAHLQ